MQVDNQPQLSILIPNIPSRFQMAVNRFNNYLEMIGDKNIEVLMLTDNKKRTIGEKREALKNLATGKYLIMADEDDEILNLDDIYNATFLDVDVIDFKVQCFNNDGSKYIVTFGLGNDIEHNTKKGRYLDCKRPPFHNCAWHEKFKKFTYPSINYGEDYIWVKQCLAEAKTEHFIDEVLFSYNFNPLLTEASTESNEYWKNPNG